MQVFHTQVARGVATNHWAISLFHWRYSVYLFSHRGELYCHSLLLKSLWGILRTQLCGGGCLAISFTLWYMLSCYVTTFPWNGTCRYESRKIREKNIHFSLVEKTNLEHQIPLVFLVTGLVTFPLSLSVLWTIFFVTISFDISFWTLGRPLGAPVGFFWDTFFGVSSWKLERFLMLCALITSHMTRFGEETNFLAWNVF